MPATLTDGIQRDPDRLDGGSLRMQRIGESLRAEALMDGALYINYGLPDTRLYERENFFRAVDHLGELIDITKPDLVLAPHPFDEHPDHRAANEAALKAAGDLPFYAYDTPSMFDRFGSPIRYTHVYRMSAEDTTLRTNYFSKFTTQVELPEVDTYLSERADIQIVYQLPEIRGRQWNHLGVDTAGVLLHQQGPDILLMNHPEIIVITGEDLALKSQSEFFTHLQTIS